MCHGGPSLKAPNCSSRFCLYAVIVEPAELTLTAYLKTCLAPIADILTPSPSVEKKFASLISRLTIARRNSALGPFPFPSGLLLQPSTRRHPLNGYRSSSDHRL